MLVDDDLPHAKVVLADRGYDSDHIRNVITSRGGTPVIMGKANRKVPILVDTITYALRNRVERWCASRPFGSTKTNAPAALQQDTTKPQQATSASLISSPHEFGSRVCQYDLAS
jgi:IS5 family transposase